MGFADAVQSAFSQYAGFSGRARRSEYWWFSLAVFLIIVLATVVDLVIGTFPAFYALAFLAVLLPSIAVGVRRLHDTGKSGWFYLLAFVPFGGIALLVFFVMDSSPDNQYGPSPKQIYARV
ncbi:MAG: DUF805 domain-containing protein [Actinobacteria bacterium]|nr:DUF805 domain-containing protein [Actinomycetota bacterium]MBW3646797.1 DUF805 domain-containing protein [Actinomycetota bacterium]